MIILVFVSVDVCDSLMNDILTDNSVSVIITLILGIAISRIPSLSMVIDQIDDFIKIFLFLYISILSFNINIFCIDLKGKKKKKLCAILIIVVYSIRLLSSLLTSRKFGLLLWNQAWATAFIMTLPGEIEISVFGVNKHKNVKVILVFLFLFIYSISCFDYFSYCRY